MRDIPYCYSLFIGQDMEEQAIIKTLHRCLCTEEEIFEMQQHATTF